jgi:RNase adaptor protein for sRNA GlmZ degradation
MLLVSFFSFSYKTGIELIRLPHGGGFIFDCRAITNPGRDDRFKPLTGRDEPVIRFLQEGGEAARLLEGASMVVHQAVGRYVERGFDNLSVGFGCTGGRHRSVYCAETLAQLTRERFDEVSVVVRHYELEALIARGELADYERAEAK